MAAIFALLLAVENALHTRKLLAPCGLFRRTCAAGYAAGEVADGSPEQLAARTAGKITACSSSILSAMFNPSSKGGYIWSRILPARRAAVRAV